MALFPHGIFIPIEGNQVTHCLGKLFDETARKDVDPNRVKSLRRKIEDLKLQIIDAAESGKKPPQFEECDWLADSTTGIYKFVWQEFTGWMKENGLDWDFEYKYHYNFGDERNSRTFTVKPASWINYDHIPKLDTTSWKQEMMDKWNKSKMSENNG